MFVVYDAAEVFTTHATNPRVYDAIMVGGTSGNITVTFQQGSSQQFLGVPAWTVLPFRTSLVTAATATILIGLKGPITAMYFNSGGAVTKSDTAPNVFDGIWVNATGDGALNITPRMNASAVPFTGLVVGTFIPLRTRLVPTGGTATAIGLSF